jgi:hypothetical protein
LRRWARSKIDADGQEMGGPSCINFAFVIFNTGIYFSYDIFCAAGLFALLGPTTTTVHAANDALFFFYNLTYGSFIWLQYEREGGSERDERERGREREGGREGEGNRESELLSLSRALPFLVARTSFSLSRALPFLVARTSFPSARNLLQMYFIFFHNRGLVGIILPSELLVEQTSVT